MEKQMEINEMQADAIYEEMREERAGISKICGVERPAPLPAMSPFEPELEDEDEDEGMDLNESYRDKGLDRSMFLS